MPESAANSYKSEVRDGMRVDWDVPIAMDDGNTLRADVFRPVAEGRYPVILSHGPYGKGLAFQEGYAYAWGNMTTTYPDTAQNSSNLYQNWEVVDPEKWVPDGYVCLRIDSRGAGRSPGYLDHNSPRELQDLAACIEWAGTQPWSNGNVGMAGISYYAINQWLVSSKFQPKHLKAICPWEGAADRYRDASHHGGILSTFIKGWSASQTHSVQHGKGERGPRSRVTGELVAGPETLPEAELARNRADYFSDLASHVLDGPYYRDRSPDLSKITIPLLSTANWGGQGLHLRGNIEGYTQAGSPQKWLEVHGGSHWSMFYTDYGVALQKKFFGHFLKGEDTGWDKQPPVQLQVRHPDEKFQLRHETEWPIARTQWTRFYLDPSDRGLTTEIPAPAAPLQYEALGPGVTFRTPPLAEPVEITGPSAVKLYASSRSTDADFFVVLRLFDPEDREVTFFGAIDPHTPIGQGWLRASHRKLAPERSRPYRPYHSHDELWPLTPNEPVELEIEILPTSIVAPAGYRLGLTILGRDYEWDGPPFFRPGSKVPMRGCGTFLHNDPEDRPQDVFGGVNTLHFARDRAPYVLLPIIPTT